MSDTNTTTGTRTNQEDLVIEYMREHRGEHLTPAQVSKAVSPEGGRRLGLRDCMARLAERGVIERTFHDKPTYMLP